MLSELVILCSVLGVICWMVDRSSYYTKEELELIKRLKEQNLATE
jgi:hypothetical protein